MSQPVLLSWIAASSVAAIVGVLLRVALLAKVPKQRAGLLQPDQPPTEPRVSTALVGLGRILIQRFHPRCGDVAPHQAKRVARSVIAGFVTVLIAGPLAGAAVGGLMMWIPAAIERRRTRQRIEGFVDDLPEVVDLLSLALGSGLNVSLAVAAVGHRASGALAAELSRVAGETERGRRLGDALEGLPARCGESVRPLATLLAAGERYGVPLIESLDRLAVEVRANERRRAEEAARRLPVKMLFPLVVCILPAFGLLTLGPMLVTSFPSLTF